MNQIRPPTTAERDQMKRRARRGAAWLIGGLATIGTAAILFPTLEPVFAGLAVTLVVVLVARFVLMKNEHARTHRLAG